MTQYSTNEICKICGVSRKQLRYYEEKGILRSVPRLGGNNYRYYTHEHIREIVAAKALKNVDMTLSEMTDVIYGKDIKTIQNSLQKQLIASRESLEASIYRYEQSAIVYAKLAEALSFLKTHRHAALANEYEVVERQEQQVVSLSYAASFEDELCFDVDYLPRIQSIAQSVNAISFGSLIYTTYDHFDSQSCTFNDQIHDYKIAVPVLDRKKHSPYYDVIPAMRGVSAIHIGTPKNKKLYHTYIGLLNWAKEQGYELENWSVEEWLISPMITNNPDFWVIQIIIPLKS